MVPLPEYINIVIKKGLINELCKSEINKLIDFDEKVLFFFFVLNFTHMLRNSD